MSRNTSPWVIKKEPRRNHSYRRSGFTLVEVLVVITIIGLLAAFFVTWAADAIGKSKRRVAEALIMKLEKGLRAYESDFQKIPDPNATITVKQAREWETIQYPESMLGQSAQLHAILGAKLRNQKVDPATGNISYTVKGPYVNFDNDEILDGEVHNYRKPIVDPWNTPEETRILRVVFDGIDHSSNSDCGTKNNEEWVDIWSEGPRVEEDDLEDGCDEDDINNFGTAQ